jgi:hypothetical protein
MLSIAVLVPETCFLTNACPRSTACPYWHCATDVERLGGRKSGIRWQFVPSIAVLEHGVAPGVAEQLQVPLKDWAFHRGGC